MARAPAKQHKDPSQTARVFGVCGAERFLKRKAIRQITDEVLGDADRALAVSEYDGSSAGLDLAGVMDDLRTLPFLTPCRLVIVREADTFITRYRGELENYTESPSSTGVLLLECKSLPATTRLYKRIETVGRVVKCDTPKPGQVPAWLTHQSQEEHGCKLDAAASALLIDLVGTDLGLLDGELAKLALYVGDRKRITAADVEALVGQTREEQVWGILSAVAACDLKKAMTLWQDVWQTDRAAVGRAIGGLAHSVRRLLEAKRAHVGGASLSEVCNMLMRWRDEARVQQELASLTIPQIENMLCRLAEADLAGKTGGLSVQASIEAFLVEACTRPRPRRAIA